MLYKLTLNNENRLHHELECQGFILSSILLHASSKTRHPCRALVAFKIMNKLCLEIILNKYLPISSVSLYNARKCRDLQIQRYRFEFARKGFQYSAQKAWNDIPAEIFDLPTLNSFKKQLKTLLKGYTQKLKNESLENQRSLLVGLRFYF